MTRLHICPPGGGPSEQTNAAARPPAIPDPEFLSLTSLSLTTQRGSCRRRSEPLAGGAARALAFYICSCRGKSRCTCGQACGHSCGGNHQIGQVRNGMSPSPLHPHAPTLIQAGEKYPP